MGKLDDLLFKLGGDFEDYQKRFSSVFSMQFLFVIGGLVAAIIVGYIAVYFATKSIYNNAIHSTAAVSKTTVLSPKQLEPAEAQFLASGDGQYDAFARVTNPNTETGTALLGYTFELLDANGTVLASRTSQSYILPNEKKMLIEVGIASTTVPAQARVTLADPVWQRATDVEAPKFNFREVVKTRTSEGYKVTAQVVNTTPFDYLRVDVSAVAKNSDGKIIGVNRTFTNLFGGESRFFSLTWKDPLNTVADVELTASADVLDANVYTQRDRSNERFLQLGPSN